MKDNSISLFATTIWGFILKEQNYQRKDYLEYIETLEKTERPVYKSNFGGFQSNDKLHTVPVFKELTKSIESLASECLKMPTQINEMWANINYKYSYNGHHVHGGALSGVFYLNVTQNSGKLVLVNPTIRSDGHILRNPNFFINPENLACILFPSYLEHYVEPNLSDTKRISLSFNLYVKSNS